MKKTFFSFAFLILSSSILCECPSRITTSSCVNQALSQCFDNNENTPIDIVVKVNKPRVITIDNVKITINATQHTSNNEHDDSDTHDHDAHDDNDDAPQAVLEITVQHGESSLPEIKTDVVTIGESITIRCPAMQREIIITLVSPEQTEEVSETDIQEALDRAMCYMSNNLVE